MFGTDESEVFPLFEILRPRALGAAGVLRAEPPRDLTG